MTALVPCEVIAVRNTVGEGILWDARLRALWWTDIAERRLHRLDWGRHTPQVFETPERLGSFGLVRDHESLVAAFETGFALYEPATAHLQWLARPAEIEAGIRFNDGRVDRSGRFWAGTMVEDEREQGDGRLYCLDGAGRAHCRLDGIRISNGLCTSPEGRRLYFADSPTRTIREFELIEPEGIIGTSRVFARTPEGAFPDGATVDADGCLWSAHWGAGCVVRYTPQGQVDRTIEVPTRQPSCVCFAGPRLDMLCVTSARQGLDPGILEREPQAGAVFFYSIGVRGLMEEEYRI